MATFESFLRSYERNRSGCEHRLVFLFKGFATPAEAGEYTTRLSRLEHEALFIEDYGYDIGAYLKAARILQSDYYFFLNSGSVLLESDWLAKMYWHAKRRNVGVVGATASCESLYTDYLRARTRKYPNTSWFRSRIRASVINRLRHLYYYPPFPNHHIRTNAFMISREVLQRIKLRRIKTRVDTSRFENGRGGLTKQILEMNLDALVVGRNGDAYSHNEWSKSLTFWQGEQENLLVADNQTDKYARADQAQRHALTMTAWGAV
jgi:hypothetical protein